MSRWRTAWHTWRAESLRSVWERAADRRADWRRERAFERRLPADLGAASSILNVAPFPLRRQWGGTVHQLLARLEQEAASRPLAVASPEPGGAWRLESTRGQERLAADLETPWRPQPLELVDDRFEAAVLHAAELTQARVVHFESLAGVPLGSVLRLRERGLRCVLSIHDFALYCPRLHVAGLAQTSSCELCPDPAQCDSLLAAAGHPNAILQAERRERAAELLQRIDALVFPSAYLRDRYRELFPAVSLERSRVIAPALAGLSPAPPRPSPPRHVAFVGSVQRHKGAHLVPEIASRLARACAGRPPRCSVFGGGDPSLTRAIRATPGVRWRGWYRSGSLSRRLRDEQVDLALLLSIWPESHGLALDECLAAGVPALAFAHGALGERIAAMQCGRLVPLNGGAAAVADTIAALAAGTESLALQPALWRVGDPADAARDHLELYANLGAG